MGITTHDPFITNHTKRMTVDILEENEGQLFLNELASNFHEVSPYNEDHVILAYRRPHNGVKHIPVRVEVHVIRPITEAVSGMLKTSIIEYDKTYHNYCKVNRDNSYITPLCQFVETMLKAYTDSYNEEEDIFLMKKRVNEMILDLTAAEMSITTYRTELAAKTKVVREHEERIVATERLVQRLKLDDLTATPKTQPL